MEMEEVAEDELLLGGEERNGRSSGPGKGLQRGRREGGEQQLRAVVARLDDVGGGEPEGGHGSHQRRKETEVPKEKQKEELV
jgi:hypothetical protein